MASLQTILASLGNTGAIHNAHRGIEQRRREDGLISSLEAALTPPTTPPARHQPADGDRTTVAA